MAGEKGSSTWYAERGAYMPAFTALGHVQRGLVDMTELASSYSGPESLVSADTITIRQQQQEEDRRREEGYRLETKKRHDLGRAGFSLAQMCEYNRTLSDEPPGFGGVAWHILNGDEKAVRDGIARHEAQLRDRDQAIAAAEGTIRNALTFGGEVRKVKDELGHDPEAIAELLKQHNLTEYEATTRAYLKNPKVLSRVIEGAREEAEAAGVHITEQVDVAADIQARDDT